MKKLINKLRLKYGLDKNGFENTVIELVDLYSANQKLVNWHGKILNNEILHKKTSDKLFILGSGPSINDISEKDWELIGEHDSIGFNYWFAHDFVPTYYLFQVPYFEDMRESMLNLLNYKIKCYKDVPFIIRGSGVAKGSFDINDKRLNKIINNQVYYINEYPLSSECTIEPNKLISYMDALGFMTFGEISKFIPKWRSTVGLLISFAYQLGYKNIVLCGIDMKGNDHFWDYDPYIKIKERYKLPDVDRSKIKSFAYKSNIENTMPEYIIALNKWMKTNGKSEIQLITDNNILNPHIKTIDVS